MNIFALLPLVLSLALAPSILGGSPSKDEEWSAYGRDAGGSRFSPLSLINCKNVKGLKVAWTYRTGALDTPSRLNAKAAFECTPLMVNGRLYIITPFNRVIALDPEKGKELWHYDPMINRDQYFNEVTSRGVSYWAAPRSTVGPCSRRIFFGTLDARLIALDADTGERCAQFGSGGEVDLKQGIEIGPDRGQYQITSPPAIVHDVLVTGSSIGDNRRVKSERGLVRAYDASTGKLKWVFDPLPPEAKYGGANAWGAIAADPERRMVFVPTGSASPDFYGGERLGDNRYANSLVALDSETGRVIWHFQAVHHDVWDYDIAAQPTLVTVKRMGKLVPAVAVMTKTAFLYLLDRETGKPLLPIEERPVPSSDVKGESTSPTQPFTAYPPLTPQGMRVGDAWGLNASEKEACRQRIESLRADGMFTPPSLRGTVQLPGQIGGVSWSGGAIDPIRGWMIVNTTRLAMAVQLIPRVEFDSMPASDPRRMADLMPQDGTPYGLFRDLLRSPMGLPCNAPPWGTVAAVDLANGQILWEKPLGTTTIPKAGADGADLVLPGAPVLGGPLVTAGGLVFVAASRADPVLRAFDVETGTLLWDAPLPAGGHATPMTYATRGGKKQFVVIAAGGHGKFASKQGDFVVAFSLPELLE